MWSEFHATAMKINQTLGGIIIKPFVFGEWDDSVFVC